jgi:RsiW-degrading membrane proteinase PrsW (M82 family)
MRDCPACHQPTPDGNFCIRCGHPLGATPGVSRQRRTQFAAAPHEHVAAPRVVSTLFPRLPHGSLVGFRISLVLGTAVVAALTVARLFPVALISAALVLPLLVALYLAEVDVYGAEPFWALALTMGWGAAAGVLIGKVALATEPSTAVLLRSGESAGTLVSGVVLPLAGLALLLCGPLILLRFRRFHEMLDGVTFGAVTGASFAGAEAIAYGVDLLSQGLRPEGTIVPWLWRLLSISVAEPVLTMSAAAVICAAVWLRYRAPVRDAGALGPLGHPAAAAALGALLVVGGALGSTFLPAGWWLVWLIAFDLAALVILRQIIHIGLLEESADRAIGPPFVCPNCGATTARHTFCGNCGVSLQALPKTRARPGDGATIAQHGAGGGP